MKIDDIDKNFKVETINKPNIRYYNPEEKPFSIHGIWREGKSFLRIPDAVAKNTSENVRFLNHNTAGGRIRFKTNSPYIAVLIEYDGFCQMSHFALTGSSSADVYVKHNGRQMYLNTFRLPFETKDKLESVIDSDFDGQLMEYTINLPSYSGIFNIFIGLDKDARIEEAEPYKNELPIVYYGSSITQGGCSTRPGLSYQNILSRRFFIDYINLGFSGSAKAEDAIVEYISRLDMSVFVMDYDHNTPSVEYLEDTHEKMFLKIRRENPDLPILILPAPIYDKNTFPNKIFAKREKIVEKTFENAIKSGDKNVYYINGKALMAQCGYEGTVDNCHPNDFGFYSMANAIADVFEKIL